MEIGSYQGCSTTWLAIAGKKSGFKKMVAIDLFTGTPSWNQKMNTLPLFNQRMKINRLTNYVEAIQGDSKRVIKKWNEKYMISILHIDGDHSYNAAKSDADNYIPLVQLGGIIIFDDYDEYHMDVIRLVNEILATKSFIIYGFSESIRGIGGSIAIKKIKIDEKSS